MAAEIISKKNISDFKSFLLDCEMSKATIKKYLAEIRSFLIFLNAKNKELTKQAGQEYREYLKESFKPQTVNGKISAINKWFTFIGFSEFKIKLLRIQKRAFVDERRELTYTEYKRLLEAAEAKGNERLYNVMVTICGTGIRISELKYITVEAAKKGYAEISMKGKERIVLLQKRLRKRLIRYSNEHGITSGHIFRTRSGKPIDRSNICHDMKKLCKMARVDSCKVFPHNLRHLFARSFYNIEKNLAHLADVLGHSSIETTRIYVATSAKAHERTLDRMRLIV